jgi:hypothetical protein
MNAFRLSRAPSRHGFASQDVLSMGDGLQVVRIDACAIAAKVIQDLPVRDLAEQSFVIDSMRHAHSPTVSHVAVTAWGNVSLPYPAAALLVDQVIDR